MDFFYHPILGLQFTCGLSLYEIDLACIPTDYDWKKSMNLMFEKGVSFVKIEHKEAITGIHTEITTNAIL